MTTSNRINLQLELADVMKFKADVLVLKHAQEKYGVDSEISYELNNKGIDLKKISPNVGHSVLVKNTGTTNFKKILFIGVNPINEFRYNEIKKFSTNALSILRQQAPHTTHIAITIHGTGYGLDENEAFLSLVAGIFDGIQNGDYPDALQKISIVENKRERVIRLQKVLEHYLRNQTIITRKQSSTAFTVELDLLEKRKTNRIDNIISEGEVSNNKKHIFVAMPFKEDMSNTYFFGIQQPIHNNKLLCERIDQATFTGDILAEIKSKIETSTAVIADLTTQNPNVYLEVGYAWGIGKPTIFIIEENDDPRFDLQGQKHIKYNKDNLKGLQEKLTEEIRALIEKGKIV